MVRVDGGDAPLFLCVIVYCSCCVLSDSEKLLNVISLCETKRQRKNSNRFPNSIPTGHQCQVMIRVSHM